MDYELLVETSEGVWVRADLGDEEPAIVLQINDLNELNSRQTSYSQAMKLPITPQNCRMFGFANKFDAKSAIPYTLRRCVLYCMGLAVISSSCRLELHSVDEENFNCQIVSNTRSLFDRLSEGAVSDIPVFERFRWSPTYVRNSNDNSNGLPYRFCAAASSKIGLYTKPTYEPFNTSVSGTLKYVNVLQALYPYYSLRRTVNSIMALHGYTLETNVESIPGYKEMYFSLPNLVAKEDTFDFIKASAWASLMPSVPWTEATDPLPIFGGKFSGAYNLKEFRSATIPDAFDEDDNGNPRWPNGLKVLEYTSPGVLTVSFDLKTTAAASVTGRVRYRISKWQVGSGEWSEVLAETDAAGVNVGVSFPADENDRVEIELSAGERVYIEAYLNEWQTDEVYTTTVQLNIDHQNNVPCPGCWIYPGESTNFKNQSEIFKLFIQLYGLFVEVDEESKTVRAYSFLELLHRVEQGHTVDWSDKIDMSSACTTSFRQGSYAQANRILFNNNELLNSQSPGIIHVQNPNLPESKDLFTLAAEGTADNEIILIANGSFFTDNGEMSARLSSEPTSRIQYLEYNSASPGNFDFDVSFYAYTLASAKTHIVTVEDLARLQQPIAYFPKGEQWNYLNKTARAVTGESIVETYYAPLKQILNPARVVEAYFELTPSDISNLDLLTPVYIEVFGDYFYIQKVDNYVNNQLTKCTLVCLNTTNN